MKYVKKTIQPYLKNIKKNCEDSKIERTSSQLENMFLKIMPKHIKRKMKTFKRVETRAKLTLTFWIMKVYIHWTSDNDTIKSILKEITSHLMKLKMLVFILLSLF